MMKKRTTPFLFSLLLCALFFSFVSDQKKVRFTSIYYGKNSGVFERKTEIIRSQQDMNDLWTRLSMHEHFTRESVPKIDFRRQTAIVCYAGDQTNGLQIDSVAVSGTTLLIYESRISLGATCHEAALLVTPFEIISVNKSGWKDFKVEERVKIQTCE